MGGVLPRVCHAASLLVTRGGSIGSLLASSSVAPPGVLGQTAALNSVQQHAQSIGCTKSLRSRTDYGDMVCLCPYAATGCCPAQATSSSASLPAALPSSRRSQLHHTPSKPGRLAGARELKSAAALLGALRVAVGEPTASRGC